MALETLSPFTGIFNGARKTVLLIGPESFARTALANALVGNCDRAVRMVETLPLVDDPDRPQIDFITFLVLDHSPASLQVVQQAMPHLGAEFLDGRCALAVARDDPTADPYFLSLLSGDAVNVGNNKKNDDNFIIGHESSLSNPGDKDSSSGGRRRSSPTPARRQLPTQTADREGVARAALCIAERWRMQAVCGSVGNATALFQFAASLGRLAKSPAIDMLVATLY